MCAHQEETTLGFAASVEDRFAVLGHEIRNPLSALNFALDAWPKTLEEPQLAEKLLQIMRRQVAQLTRLCKELLDNAKLDQGAPVLCQSFIDVGQVIQTACEGLRPFIDQSGHTLTVALGSSPVTLFGDESKLTQVFSNLLHNSAKFTYNNGHLHVSLEKEDGVAVIKVRDNGCGLSAEDVQNIFLPCRTSSENFNCRETGLGIGLRLAKSIVELHGGTLEAFSPGVGFGSTFEVRLPIANVAATQSEKVEHSHAAALPRYRIAVVDDDRSMRFLMSILLKNLQQTVTVSDSGEKAIETIVQLRPQVVFLDLQMPHMNGFELARRLRMRTDMNGITLIALSGNSDAASKRLAAEAGFDQYLVKPISLAELSESLLRVAVQNN